MPEDWSGKVITPNPALSKRWLYKGYVPPIAQRVLAYILAEINKNYLA